MDEYQAIMTRKLGLPKYNKDLISKLLNNMAVDKVDYTNFFRLLSNVKADPSIPEAQLLTPLKAVLLDIGKERREAWTSWVKSYVQEVIMICMVLSCNLFNLLCQTKRTNHQSHTYESRLLFAHLSPLLERVGERERNTWPRPWEGGGWG